MGAIYKRRSIRKYQSTPVPQEKLREFIKAGMNAPSAGDQQPWVFIIIDKRKILDKIPEVHPYSKMLHQAQVAILVCGDIKKEKHKDYWVQDCSAATENILLEIADQDFGAVWLGVYPRQDRVIGIQKMLNLPEHIIPFSLIPVGYPAEEKPGKNVFHEEMIRFNGWE